MENNKTNNLEDHPEKKPNSEEKEPFWVFMTKHKLRWVIWIILYLYHELNATQLSQMVEQSRSTVSRQLKIMEERGILTSRTPKRVPEGKISPRYYRRKREIYDVDAEFNFQELGVWDLPEDTKNRREFYKTVVEEHRIALDNNRTILDMYEYLIDILEENIGNIKEADRILKKYFTTRDDLPMEALFYKAHFDDKGYKKFIKIYERFVKLVWEIKKEQELDPERKERYFAYYGAFMPLKAIFEANKEKFRKLKKP